MKLIQDNSFKPVTLVIETKEELLYLFALSNSSLKQVDDHATDLNICLPDSNQVRSDLQDLIYETLKEAVENA